MRECDRQRMIQSKLKAKLQATRGISQAQLAGADMSGYATSGDMIFQMLSRHEYTNREIARFIGCSPEVVTLVARERASEIAKNYAKYAEYRAAVDRIAAKAHMVEPDNRDDIVCAFVSRICNPPYSKRGVHYLSYEVHA